MSQPVPFQAWSSAYGYHVGDTTVGSDGQVYSCIEANTDEAPPNGTYWVLVPKETNPNAEPAFTISADAATLGIEHFGNLVELTYDGAAALTVAPDSTLDVPVGTWVDLVANGATVTVTAGEDVTIDLPAGFTLVLTAGVVTRLEKIGADLWSLGAGTVKSA